MFLKTVNRRHNSSGSCSFNMTAVIDIVFLLMIFFLVVCQFIEAENFPVAVPDGCKFAQSELEPGGQVTTVTVIKTVEGASEFAVGPEKITESGNVNIVDELAELIDVRLKDLPADNRVVTLRIDRSVCFAEAQHALAAVAESTATDIKLAAFKDKRTHSQ
ncbi:MAG: ExbD/TolR family protein [Planctomycetota bacterium]|jgi:biopolymer transport protein ExbD